MILQIKPQPKGRPRFSGHAYTDEKTRQYEKDIKMLYKYSGGKKYDGAVALYVVFCYKTSQSKNLYSHKKTRPDVDNLLKALMDGLNGVAWNDDSQVVTINARKMWDLEDKIEIDIQKVSI